MPRNNSKKLARAALRQKALALRVTGMAQRAIAAKLDKSVGWVNKTIADELARLAAKSAESSEQIVALEVQRLDELLLEYWNGPRLVENANVILRIMERRSKLQGLDKPTQTELGGFDGAPLIPPVIGIGFKNGGPGKPDSGAKGA